MRINKVLGAALVVFAAGPLVAQGRGTGQGRGADGVPPGHRPPAGMCRIWIDGVPPGKQPAPTDCATAVARRPANARVIFGDETPFPGRGKSENRTVECASGSTIGGILGIPWPIGADTLHRDRRCRDLDGASQSGRDGRGQSGATVKDKGRGAGAAQGGPARGRGRSGG